MRKLMCHEVKRFINTPIPTTNSNKIPRRNPPGLIEISVSHFYDNVGALTVPRVALKSAIEQIIGRSTRIVTIVDFDRTITNSRRASFHSRRTRWTRTTIDWVIFVIGVIVDLTITYRDH